MYRMLAYIDSIRADAPHFHEHVTEAMELFLNHAEHEEQVLPLLLSKLSAEENMVRRSFVPSRLDTSHLPTPLLFVPWLARSESLESSSRYVQYRCRGCVRGQSADT
jgi:hypothetical protein